MLLGIYVFMPMLQNLQHYKVPLCLILDALVLEKAIADDPVLQLEDDREQIVIKVQSSTKTINYKLCKVSKATYIRTSTQYM